MGAAVRARRGHADATWTRSARTRRSCERRPSTSGGSREHRRLTLVSWDYNNLRIDTLVAPLSIIANVAGLLLALAVATRDGGPGVAAVIVTVAYLAQATGVLFEFNQI